MHLCLEGLCILNEIILELQVLFFSHFKQWCSWILTESSMESWNYGKIKDGMKLKESLSLSDKTQTHLLRGHKLSYTELSCIIFGAVERWREDLSIQEII